MHKPSLMHSKIKVVGDDIYFEGARVARLIRGAPPSRQDAFICFLLDGEDETIDLTRDNNTLAGLIDKLELESLNLKDKLFDLQGKLERMEEGLKK